MSEKHICEQCNKKHDASTSVPTADDCYLCANCHEDWLKNVFLKCSHQWDKRDEDEEYLYCKGCSGVIHKESTYAQTHPAPAL